jgi:hypothetical protein
MNDGTDFVDLHTTSLPHGTPRAARHRPTWLVLLASNRAANLRGRILRRNRTGNVVNETPACVPVSPDGAAPGEQSIAANAVYLAGPKRIQGTPFWTEAVEVLRQRFAKHHVIVAGDGTFRRYKPVPIRELKALVLIVPPDGLVGFGSYLETSNALRFRRPTWVYVNGELRSGFALHINDAESFLLFGRVEPAIDGTGSVERYAKAPSRQPASQAAETIAR